MWAPKKIKFTLSTNNTIYHTGCYIFVWNKIGKEAKVSSKDEVLNIYWKEIREIIVEWGRATAAALRTFQSQFHKGLIFFSLHMNDHPCFSAEQKTSNVLGL